MNHQSGDVFRLEDYRPAAYSVSHCDLTFRLDPECTRVTAKLRIVRGANTEPGAPLELDGDELRLAGVRLNGTELDSDSYSADKDRFVLSQTPATDSFEIEFDTELSPASNTKLMGLYRSNGVYCTQCEAEGFRRITYFADRPDVLSVYTVRIEADRKTCPVLLSNGNPVESGDLGSGRHYAVWQDPWPKPSYLFALVAGDLGALTDRFTTRSGRDVQLNIYVEHGKEARAAYAMDSLKRSMKWDEDVWGREYDLDLFNIVAVSDFNMGAMENKGLNVFNDKYVLADPDTATDQDYAAIEAIIAHEYFHNWTGNRITCRDWFQLCLKEGLTVYRDHEFSADQRSRAVKRIAEVKALRAAQFPEDAGPLAHPVRPRRYKEINNFYTATVYEKGSEIIRMLRTVIGDEAFFDGMNIYFDRHDGQAVTIEDFVACFEEAAETDLGQFAQWYHQAGTPSVNASFKHDRARRTFTISLEQSLRPTPGETRKRLNHIPLAAALFRKDGTVMEPDKLPTGFRDGVLHLTRRNQEFVFENVPERPVVSLLRGFSAPVTLAAVQPKSDLEVIARHETDLFSRWEAIVRLATDELITATKKIRGGQVPAFGDTLPEILVDLAGDETLEPAFRAQALVLPSENDLAREIGHNVDPDAVHGAREALIAHIAEAGTDTFPDIEARMRQGGAFSPDADSAGRRALANAMLDYASVAARSPDAAYNRFSGATNMTDRMAALTTLAHRFSRSEATGEALAAFEKRFGNDALVMDKWFSVQATAPGAAALDTVKALVAHKSYNPGNPNRVRSLAGMFANGNQTGFNRADGESYRWYCELVGDTDKRNPQLAARLMTAMRSWRALEAGRRQLARTAISDLLKGKDLSVDLREIAERIIA